MGAIELSGEIHYYNSHPTLQLQFILYIQIITYNSHPKEQFIDHFHQKMKKKIIQNTNE